MGLKFEYASGATPLDPDEVAGLIPPHIVNQAQLNEWEQQNIVEGQRWALSRKRKDLLSLRFIETLHKRMFGKTWKWAGQPRETEKNIGINPHNIRVELKKLCEDVQVQLEYKSYSFDEIAARFHHRLTKIHPFPNGNGRHARLLTDLLLVQNGAVPFTWGAGDLVSAGAARDRYLAALRAADGRDYAPLFAFVRSGSART